MHVFADSNVAICQLMLFKCPVGMLVQVHIHKRILYRIQKSDVVVFVHWLPSKMLPIARLRRLL